MRIYMHTPVQRHWASEKDACHAPTCHGSGDPPGHQCYLPTDLLDQARELGLNVSQACEGGLKAGIARYCAAQWLQENREALASSNDYVERHGLPLAEFRQF